MITNKCTHPEDIACQDGICPDCNYYEYQLWMEAHAHCDYDKQSCPDPEDCPHNKHLVDLPPNNVVIPKDKIAFTLTKDMTDQEIEDTMQSMLEKVRKGLYVPEDLLGKDR